jgi:hypothetical protein
METLSDILEANEKSNALAERLISYKLKCAFPGLTIFGEQISLGRDGDYLSLQEAQAAVRELAEQLGVLPRGVMDTQPQTSPTQLDLGLGE